MTETRLIDSPARLAGTAPPAEPGLGERGALQNAGAAFHALADTMPQIVWSTLPNGDHDYYNAHWYAFTGVEPGSSDGEGWAELFHPEDRENAWARWRHSLDTGEPYEVEYRLRHHSGAYLWVIGRALPVRDAQGQILRWIGTCTDIENAKETAENNEVLSRELSHRIKNIFAVISSLIGLTARSNPKIADTALVLQGRIAALGRAHEFVRPHSDASRPEFDSATLQGLLASLMSAYPAFDEGRLTITGGDIDVHDRAATPIAMVFHELATNSLKHGALSVDEGTVEIILTDEGEDFALTWRERGGPAVTEIPELSGFGSKLTTLAVEHQLGGKLEREWDREGLTLTMRVRRERVS